ncbi:MAG: DNA translocase FtsK 4TM domain-containing protein, partial [Pirellula sp.]|nr:DNA translocase FtsK 4TM domain-containing protein [Pirellula sp.]
MENQRSVRWDVASVAMFAASALLWLSLLTHDAADNLGEFNGILANFYSPIHAAYPFNESIQNSCGYIGALASDVLFQATGIGAYLVASLMILSGVVMLRQQPWASPMGRSIGWTLILIAVCSMPTRFGIQPRIPVPIGGGGYLGALCNTWMNQHLAQAGSVILVLTVFIGGLLLSTEYALIRYFGFAATGSIMALKWFRLPTWTMRRHAEMISGTFSPSRSDLPKSVTLRQNPASITASGSNHAGQTAYPSAVIHAAPLAGGSISSNATIDTGENGPAIRIGRRAEASLTALDLASQSKAVGRTDLTFPKATTTLASIAGAFFGSKKNSEKEENEVVDDEDGLQVAGSSREIADHKTIVSGRKPVSPKVEYHDDDELDEDEDATIEDEEMELEGDGEQENDDEVHSVDDEDQIVVEPPKKRGAGRSRSIRSDAAHIEEDKGPRVKNRKEKTEVVDDSSPQLHEDLHAQLNDTKLPEGSEEYVLPGHDLLSESDEISYDE